MLRERIDNDFTAAVKARDAFVVSVLRMLRAALKNREIDKRGELDESDTLDVISKEMKKLKESLDAFRSGGRDDLVEKTEAEIAVLQKYLPEALSEEELRTMVQKAIAEIGDVTQKDFGKVMSAVMKEAKGRADGNAVSAVVKAALTG